MKTHSYLRLAFALVLLCGAMVFSQSSQTTSDSAATTNAVTAPTPEVQSTPEVQPTPETQPTSETQIQQTQQQPNQQTQAQHQAQSQPAVANNTDRQKEFTQNTQQLLKLANELNQAVNKSSQNTLSLDVIKKAEEIEKLAKEVKEKMKSE